MIDHLTQLLAERTSQVITRRDTQAALTDLIRVAVDAGLCDFASISHFDGGVLVTAAASDPAVRELNDAQYRLGQGPVVNVMVAASTVHSDDAPSDLRWPLWAPVAGAHGITAVYCVGLPSVGGPSGSVCLYSTGQGTVGTGHAVRAAALIADYAALAFVAMKQMAELWKAVDARHRIGQAQGILMERHHVDADAAFKMMRGLSQHHTTPVRTIAGNLIDTRELTTERTSVAPARPAVTASSTSQARLSG